MTDQAELRRLRETLNQEKHFNPDMWEKVQALLVLAEQGNKEALSKLQQFETERATRSYQGIDGTDPTQEPGILLVCPVDPSHFSDYDRGVEEICPVHKVKLVPKA